MFHRFSCVADGLSVGFKKPCIVFAGHPSLRFGDAIHFVKMWGHATANSIIFVGQAVIYVVILMILLAFFYKAVFVYYTGCP